MSDALLEARDLHRGFRSGEAYLPVVNGVNFSVFGFCSAAGVLAGITFGLAPALMLSRKRGSGLQTHGGRLTNRGSRSVNLVLGFEFFVSYPYFFACSMIGFEFGDTLRPQVVLRIAVRTLHGVVMVIAARSKLHVSDSRYLSPRLNKRVNKLG